MNAPPPLQTYSHERNHGCRIRELIYRGHRCVSMENGVLRLLVVPDKGADILEFLHKPTDTDFLWHSYNGLRPAGSSLASSPLPDGPFRDTFPGGWFEMLPNGPHPCTHRGARFGYHGEATFLPWSYRIESDTPDRIEVRFQTRLTRMPVLVEKSISLFGGSPEVTIHERLTSEGGQELEVLWGQHPTFGPPFLEPGCQVFVPPSRMNCPLALPNTRLAVPQAGTWPLAKGPGGEWLDLSTVPDSQIRSHDFVVLDDYSEGSFAIWNPRRKIGFRLRWDARLFPVLGFWQLYRGSEDYPWYGTNYLVAFEPACGLFSLSEAAKEGTALRLQPGEPLQTTFQAEAISSTPASSAAPAPAASIATTP